MNQEKPLSFEQKKEYRRAFLQSCCDNFVAIMKERRKIAYCDPTVSSSLTEMYYDLLPEIRAELADEDGVEPKDHPVDRHKAAAATAHIILATQPMRDQYQLQQSNTFEGDEPCSLLNSQFAIYTSVAMIDQWRVLSGEEKIVVSERGKRFFREHVKLMTRCHTYPIFSAAQSFYLLEELCLAEMKTRNPGLCVTDTTAD